MVVKVILAIILLCILFKVGKVLLKVAAKVLGFVGILIIAATIFRWLV